MGVLPDLTFAVYRYDRVAGGVASKLATSVVEAFNSQFVNASYHAWSEYTYEQEVRLLVKEPDGEGSKIRREARFIFADKSLALVADNPASELMVAFLLLIEQIYPDVGLSPTVCTSDLSFCERAYELARMVEPGIKWPSWMDGPTSVELAPISVPDAMDFRK